MHVDVLMNSNPMKINQQTLSARLPTMYSEKDLRRDPVIPLSVDLFGPAPLSALG